MFLFCSTLKLVHRTVRHITLRSFSNLSYYHNPSTDRLRAITLGRLLEEGVEKFGDRKAVISRHQNRAITFREVLKEADRLAAGLVKLGFQKNDRLGLWAPNLIEWYVAKFAAARAGLVLVLLNPGYQPPEVEYCVNKVGIKGIVCASKLGKKDDYYYKKLLDVDSAIGKCEANRIKSDKMPTLRTVIFTSNNKQNGAFGYGEVLDLPSNDDILDIQKLQKTIQPDSPCDIQFTSGTTGKPKGAVVSHYHLVNNGFFIGKRNELNQKHQTICVQVPFFHAFGTSITISAALNHGATLVLPSETYNPNKNLDAIVAEKCTIIHGTPTMYVDLVHCQQQRKEDISPEIAVSGGALCSPHLFKAMLKELKVKKVKSVYGLSETTAVVFQSDIDDNEEQSTTTVGKVGEHIEVKIVDEEGGLVPFGTPGELCVRSYCNMLEYWDDEEKTREIISSDRWLKTGDQFVLTENGYGSVVGRLKEMIIRGGENIFPKEIEDFLNTHPHVLEAHVVGVPHERLGEEVCACIRIKPGCEVTLEDLKRFCQGKLSSFKIPSRLLIVNTCPKTTSGKIQKYKLVELLKGR